MKKLIKGAHMKLNAGGPLYEKLLLHGTVAIVPRLRIELDENPRVAEQMQLIGFLLPSIRTKDISVSQKVFDRMSVVILLQTRCTEQAFANVSLVTWWKEIFEE
jgi:hypothetical protein